MVNDFHEKTQEILNDLDKKSDLDLWMLMDEVCLKCQCPKGNERNIIDKCDINPIFGLAAK